MMIIIKPLLALGTLVLNCMVVCDAGTHYCQKCTNVDSPEKCNLFAVCSHKGCFYEARKGWNGRVSYSGGCGSSDECLGFRSCCYFDFCNGFMLSELSKQFTTRLPTTLRTTLPTTLPTTITTEEIPVSSTPTPFTLTKGGTCYVCSGETCGLSINHDTTECPDTFPYCQNVIQNDEMGNKLITKRCASFRSCQLANQQRGSNPNCSNYDAADIYASQFECSFCCETSFCNVNVIPTMNTMFLGQ